MLPPSLRSREGAGGELIPHAGNFTHPDIAIARHPSLLRREGKNYATPSLRSREGAGGESIHKAAKLCYPLFA